MVSGEPSFDDVLERAADLQRLVPGAVLVGGTASAFHAQAVGSQLIRQLAEPQPRDAHVTKELHRYRQLDQRWHDWAAVQSVLTDVAIAMTTATQR